MGKPSWTVSKMKLTFYHLTHISGLHILWQLKGTRTHSLAQKLSSTAGPCSIEPLPQGGGLIPSHLLKGLLAMSQTLARRARGAEAGQHLASGQKQVGWMGITLAGIPPCWMETTGNQLKNLKRADENWNTLSWKKISSSNHDQYLLRDQPEDWLCCWMWMLSTNWRIWVVCTYLGPKLKENREKSFGSKKNWLLGNIQGKRESLWIKESVLGIFFKQTKDIWKQRPSFAVELHQRAVWAGGITTTCPSSVGTSWPGSTAPPLLSNSAACTV